MLLPPSLNQTGSFLHGIGEKEMNALFAYAHEVLPEVVDGLYDGLSEEEIYDIVIDVFSRMPVLNSYSEKVKFLDANIPAYIDLLRLNKENRSVTLKTARDAVRILWKSPGYSDPFPPEESLLWALESIFPENPLGQYARIRQSEEKK